MDTLTGDSSSSRLLNTLQEPSTTWSLEVVRRLKADLSRISIKDLVEPCLTSHHGSEMSGCLLVDLFRPCLEFYRRIENQFHLKVASCDVLGTWLTKACKACVEAPDIIPALTCTVQEEDFQALYDSMLQDWDLGGPIHAPLREVFTKTLDLQRHVVKNYEEDQRVILSAALEMDHSQKSLYYAIEILRKTLGTSAILASEPDFFVLRVPSMQETSIATPLGRLLANVMLTSLPATADLDQQLKWLESWQNSITQALFSEDAILTNNLLTYLIPDLFKASRVAFVHFMRELSHLYDHTATSLMVIIQSLRKAKDVQIIGDIDEDLLDELSLSREILLTAMVHDCASLRVAVLNLLVFHPKPKTFFPASTYHTLKQTVSSLFHETDMQNRKEIMDGLRSFFIRFQASLYSCQSLLKKATSNHGSAQSTQIQSYLDTSKAFAVWLLRFFKKNLEAGSGYQVTYMSLQSLQLAAAFGWHAGTPVACQKYAAFKPSKSPDLEKVIPLDLVLFDNEMIRLLMDQLSNSFDDNRTLALALLSSIRQPLSGLSTQADLQLIMQNSARMLQSTRGRDADGGGRVLQFVFQNYVLTDSELASDLFASSKVKERTSTYSSRAIAYLQGFASSIVEDATLAHTHMLTAAQTRPLHGRLKALCYMIECIDYASLSENDLEGCASAWLSLHGSMIQLCNTVWQAVKEVLCDDSPEGNLPESIGNQVGGSLRGPDTQVILSFCWRALREASTLLRIVVQRAPIPTLLETDFITAGELSLSWLTEVRHRGAFSAVFPNYIDLNKILQTRKTSTTLSAMPKLWLERNIDELTKTTHSKDITRRSGGLPMSIISLMISEVESGHGQRTLVDLSMHRLIELVSTPVERTNDSVELPQVHGFNTLKDIFLESKLATCSIDYVEKCFNISIDGFSSRLW